MYKDKETKSVNNNIRKQQYMKKLPESIKTAEANGEIIVSNLATAIKAMVKRLKVKPYHHEEANISKNPEDLTKEFFLMHFNSTDEAVATLPDGYEDYKVLFNEVAEIVENHIEAEKQEKENDAREKEAKRALKENERVRKENEDKEAMKNQMLFETSFIDRGEKSSDNRTKLIPAVLKAVKLPSGIAFMDSGMGLSFGDNITPQQLGEAAASIITAAEGQSNLEGALQFSMGDLVNQFVKRRLFKTNAEAQNHISVIVNEKLGRNYNPGSLNQYAKMSERIPSHLRKAGIAPSLYLQASKATPPRITGGSTPQTEKEFDEFRISLVEKINGGEVQKGKDIVSLITKYKDEKGVVTDNAASDRKRITFLQTRLFNAVFAATSLVGKTREGVAVFALDGAEAEVDKPTLNKIINDTTAEIASLLKNKADYASAKAGVRSVDGKESPFFLKYPFEEQKEDKEEETPTETVPTEEVPPVSEPDASENDASEDDVNLDDVE